MQKIYVVAAVIEDDGKILCVQRPDNKFQYIAHKWEFPGGKIEEGETRQSALVREIREELCLNISIREELTTTTHSYPDFHLTMYPFSCELSAGTRRTDLVLNEHISHEWLATTQNKFAKLNWAAADQPVVESLIASETKGHGN